MGDRLFYSVFGSQNIISKKNIRGRIASFIEDFFFLTDIMKKIHPSFYLEFKFQFSVYRTNSNPQRVLLFIDSTTVATHV